MANRDYIQPKIPSDWKGAERTYAIMLQNVLDDLHMPIKESDLSDSLLDTVYYGYDGKKGADSQNYSQQIKDTGIKWIDGKTIKKVTQEINVPANVAVDSDSIYLLGNIIKVEGYVLTGAGDCYIIGHNTSACEVNVWKIAEADTFKILSTVGGTAYVTVYYTQGEEHEPPQPGDTLIFFNDGYTEYDGGGGTIEWAANMLTRPNDGVHGYTTYGYASLDQVSTNGRLWLYNGTGANYYYNSHVCTAQLIDIPVGVTKLKVIASRGPNTAQINFALLPNDAPNSMDTSNGGKITTFYTLSTTPTEYSLELDSEMIGTAGDYRIVINYRGKSDVYRTVYITKVFFE